MFNEFAMRGLQLDGTHIKSNYRGILLVACFKDGDNKIRILGVAVVESEDDDNCSWFLRFLMEHIQRLPAFVISDRGNGFLRAVANEPRLRDVPHQHCFRHIMENLHRQVKMKNKEIGRTAWGIAKATKRSDFCEMPNKTTGTNFKGLSLSNDYWIRDVHII